MVKPIRLSSGDSKYLKEASLTIVGLLFLLGLVLFQLPISPWERVLSRPFELVQKLTHTNRQYRMYAPDPSSRKFPYLIRLTSVDSLQGYTKISFHSGQTKTIAQLSSNFLTQEKIDNLLNSLIKSQRGIWPQYPKAKSSAVFNLLAEKLCRSSYQANRRLQTIALGYREVNFRHYGKPPQKLEPTFLLEHSCQQPQ